MSPSDPFSVTHMKKVGIYFCFSRVCPSNLEGKKTST